MPENLDAELRISNKIYASPLMLKAKTNHLSSCEGSKEEDLHMVKKEKEEEKEEIRPHLMEGQNERRSDRQISSFSNRGPQSSPAILPKLGRSQQGPEPRAVFSARSKISYLEIQAGETRVLPKFYSAIFIVKYLLQGGLEHLCGLFVSSCMERQRG